MAHLAILERALAKMTADTPDASPNKQIYLLADCWIELTMPELIDARSW